MNGVTDRPIKIKTADGWQDVAVQGPQGNIGPVGPAGSELVYKYTVTGADKASIDTGVDTPDAGTNDWTNGDLLEIYIVSRTDDAGAIGNVVVTLNNDSGGKYDRQVVLGTGTTVQAANSLAQTAWTLDTHGSGGSATYPGMLKITIPNFSDTTFFKICDIIETICDATSGNNNLIVHSAGYRDASAITRLKIAAASTKKFKVGTKLLIYKRTSAAGSLDGGSP